MKSRSLGYLAALADKKNRTEGMGYPAIRRYDQKTKSDVVADSDCYGSTVNFAGPGRRRI